MRCTCVSTTTPTAFLNHDPSTTLAVLRATPGSVSSLSISSGTCPPKSLTIFLAAPTTDFDLLRKNPVERTSGSSCSGVSAANAATVGYLRKSSGVTRFTFTSVDCADRMVATSSSHALAWVSAQVTSGYRLFNRFKMSATRSGAIGLYPLAGLDAAFPRETGTLLLAAAPLTRAIGLWSDFAGDDTRATRTLSWRPVRAG